MSFRRKIEATTVSGGKGKGDNGCAGEFWDDVVR